MSVPLMTFVKFLIEAFKSQDRCTHRIFRLIEGFWKKKFLKKFITRVVTENFFFQSEPVSPRNMIKRILLNSLSKIKFKNP